MSWPWALSASFLSLPALEPLLCAQKPPKIRILRAWVLISLAVIDACRSLGFDVTRIAAFPFDISSRPVFFSDEIKICV